MEEMMTCGRRWSGLCASLLVLYGISLDPRPAAAQGPQPPALTGALAGTIVSKDSGRAVANATVSIEGTRLTVTANDGGRFRFDRVPAGQVSLVVQAPGFLDLRLTGIAVRARETSVVGAELEPTPKFMDRIQVTATKTPLSVGEIAAQASIIDRAAIDRKGDQTLPQAIAHTPGAVVSTQLGLFDSVMLRGLPRGDPEFTNTLLLVDGIPQTLSNNGARVNALTMNDASSIEIVRGPNSAVYGRTAIGGSVNLRTADPTPTHQYGVDITAGEFAAAKGVVRASGPVLDWGGYYFSLAQERDGGYFENKTTDDFAVGNKALFAKFAFTIDPKSFGSVSVNRVVADSSTPTNEPIVDGQLLHNLEPAFDRFTNFNLPGRNYRQSEGRLTVNYERQFTPTTKMVGLLGYRAVKLNFVRDGDFIGSPFDLEAHTATQFPFNQETDEDIFYEELRFELHPTLLRGRKDTLLLGASHEGNKGAQSFTDISVGAAFDGWPISYLDPVFPAESTWIKTTSNQTYHFNSSALFAQYTLDAGSRSTLTAAGRFDRLNMDNTRSAVTTKKTFNAFSPKLSATYRLVGGPNGADPAVNVYGAYSHAFLPPRRPSALIPADASLDLKPESINNYEGGLKGSLLGGRLALDATYFFMTENGVVLGTREGALFRPTNSGEQRYKGVETGVQASLSPKVSVYANASFYRNRFGDFVVQSEDGAEFDEVLTGNRLPISPDYVANFGASVRPTSMIDFSLDVKRMGAVEANRENTFLIDPFTLVDAAVSWHRGRVRVTLSGHNLLDEEYYSNSDGDTADPGRPRQVLVTTSVRFR
jgi:iron complex outermembrane receptor protein